MEDYSLRPWGVSATFAWALLALIVAQAIGVIAVLALYGGAAASLVRMRYDGSVLALITLISNPIQVAVLFAAARRAGWDPANYLGLARFHFFDLLIGVVTTLALIAAIDIFGVLIGQEVVSRFQAEAYVSVQNYYWLAALALAVIVIGPAGEEILFRGFMFRGFVRRDRNPMLAIIVISALWTILHIQYDWFGMLQVFVIGLLLGWLRLKSGSTILTILLHGLMNAESSIETVIKMGLPG
jgi:membrane protease YdiL (CAAX protease family)